MNSATLLWIIGLSAAGTFLIRYLPMAWHERERGSRTHRPRVRRALDAVGPSAIVALLVASVWEMLKQSPNIEGALPVLGGILGVLAGRWLTRSIAGATLLGVFVYGLVVWMLSR